jgi:hypothetical protein
MMTTLEKLALRIAAEWQDAPIDMATFSWADVNGWTKDMAFDCARAALEAIREPGECILQNFRHDPDWSPSMWSEGIDAILNERTG